MKTIVHVIVGLDRGGAEMMLRRLIEANLSSDSKIKHCVISLTDLGFHGRFLQERGVAVYAMGLSASMGLLTVGLRLTLLLRKLNPDVVQTWMVHSDLIGGVAARLAGVRRVVWGVRTTDYSVESRSTRAVRWLCARLSGFIPSKIVSAAQASLESSKQAGYSAEKLMVIHNGFDVAALQSYRGKGEVIREQIATQSEILVIGCLGRYNPAKDHVNFVRAAGLVAAKYPTCHFLMVGSGLTRSNAELMFHINSTGFAERFVLLGERPDPAACMDAMDIFVLSSCTEGFPNVLGEAMAMGVPCVSTDVGDAAVLLGDTGELVPPRNSTALAGALERILDKPLAEREALGQSGRERIEKVFSIETAARRFDDLYSTLAKKR
jgi:glycosyltransferase involved in cell wall biosynthesis